MPFPWIRWFSSLIWIGFPVISLAAPAPSHRPNILFIAVDDLNHWVGHLDRNAQTRTPNIDRLARMGVTFRNAHCAAPVCNPSRAALLSGLRPGTTGVYANGQDYRRAFQPDVCLPLQFRKAGYQTLVAGKIYHGGGGDPSQWDVVNTPGPADPTPDPRQSPGVGGIKFAPLNCADHDLRDWRIASFAVDQLGTTHDRPFLLAIGFHKPHMPWNVPRKYYELFPVEQIQLPPNRESDLADIPPAGVRMAKPEGDHAAMLGSGRWKEAVQAYLATIAYLDMNVGRVLDAFEKSSHRSNTVIVLWGDHGWHLGEKQHWRKFALWEEATRAPFIWVAPGITKPGGVCDRTVDFMSVYPTLCDLAGLPVPKHVEGQSIRQLLAEPDSPWDHPAITTFGQNNHAIRTERWRYIRYADGGEELYDHQDDPYEWTNLAGFSQHAAAKAQLVRWLPQSNAPELPRRDANTRSNPRPARRLSR